jgi:glycosyltransferase involved in cell wall biosynthesis
LSDSLTSAPSPNNIAEITVTLLLPTLNEIEGLKLVVPQLDRDLVDDILVLDGGSTDGTVEYAHEQGLRVERQRRKGLGPGIFDAVYEMKTSHVIEFSPDGNCLVEALPELVARIREGYDMVMVSRYLPPAKSQDDTFLTGIGNFLFTRMFRMLGSFPITDVLGMYRGYRCDIVRNYDFEHYLYGPVLEPLVTAICSVNGLSMMEIPGDEPLRVGDESKMSIPYNGSCILLMFVRLFIRKYLKIKI